MSSSADKRTTGRWDGAFHTTHWTEIFDARSGEEPRRSAALEALLGRYWRPVYCYLRCKGYDTEKAKDLTQGFFQEVVLGRGLVEKADRARARFRTFLLRALERYLRSVHRGVVAKRRMPEGGMVRLDGLEGPTLPELVHYATPVEVFDYAWATALLDRVLGEVATECRESGRVTHWSVFEARVLLPITENAECASLSELCEKLDIASKSTISKMTVAVKRRFRGTLRRHVRQLVDSDSEVDGEIGHLMKVLSRRDATL
jgi:hypothetical protein